MLCEMLPIVLYNPWLPPSSSMFLRLWADSEIITMTTNSDHLKSSADGHVISFTEPAPKLTYKGSIVPKYLLCVNISENDLGIRNRDIGARVSVVG
jgi:hypothetical protein